MLEEVRAHYLGQAWKKSVKNKEAAARMLGLKSANSFRNWCDKAEIKRD